MIEQIDRPDLNREALVVKGGDVTTPAIEFEAILQVVDSLEARDVHPPFPVEDEVSHEPKRRWAPDELRRFGSYLVDNMHNLTQYLREDGMGDRGQSRTARFCVRATDWFLKRGWHEEEVEVRTIPNDDINIRVWERR